MGPMPGLGKELYSPERGTTMKRQLSMTRPATVRRAGWKRAATAIAGLLLASCANLSDIVQSPAPAPAHRSVLASAPANFEGALRENQAALSAGKIAPDVALYNAGFLFAHPANPKRDHARAIQSFQTLIAEHPGSSLVDPARSWIEVLEQQQKVAEERRKLAEEKRALERERDLLAQERQRLNYANEKSRQLDTEIERRRRQSLSK